MRAFKAVSGTGDRKQGLTARRAGRRALADENSASIGGVVSYTRCGFRISLLIGATHGAYRAGRSSGRRPSLPAASGFQYQRIHGQRKLPSVDQAPTPMVAFFPQRRKEVAQHAAAWGARQPPPQVGRVICQGEYQHQNIADGRRPAPSEVEENGQFAPLKARERTAATSRGRSGRAHGLYDSVIFLFIKSSAPLLLMQARAPSLRQSRAIFFRYCQVPAFQRRWCVKLRRSHILPTTLSLSLMCRNAHEIRAEYAARTSTNSSRALFLQHVVCGGLASRLRGDKAAVW